MEQSRKATGRPPVKAGEPRVIALAGNPNVGKSTVFNHMTKSRQHTGNWSGKTVSNARGCSTYHGRCYQMIDIPGCYSLMAHSAEEEVARDFLCFGQLDGVVVVCDATCLQRNLPLVLQILEVVPRVAVCVNLLDEAKKKGIRVDLDLLQERLGVPVVGTAARSGKGIEGIYQAMDQMLDGEEPPGCPVAYGAKIEGFLKDLEPVVAEHFPEYPATRWLSARLLDGDEGLWKALEKHLGMSPLRCGPVVDVLFEIQKEMEALGWDRRYLEDQVAAAFVKKAEKICRGVIRYEKKNHDRRDRFLDRLFTGKRTGFPMMLLFLMVIFWITIEGANLPSQWLSQVFGYGEGRLLAFFEWMGAPDWLTGVLVHGMYRVLAWVVSVMLPPMAIFFPLFTLLEDFGYLPRVAFNLDKCFQKCRTCGKQALTTCMGFGCNAAAVVGCRIIDSPRERLIAMITNSFVPCNGRYPTMIALISMFFIGGGALTGGSLGADGGNAGGSSPCAALVAAAILTGVIVWGILLSLLVSRFLSATLLKGAPSPFALELPPYRRPQIGRVILRSILDRTLFVLGRAVVVAAPAGMLIWLMANVTLRGNSLLAHCSGFLDPLGRLLGMDGVILVGFLLGFPANEIVMPIILMAYTASGTLTEVGDLTMIKTILLQNGWTWVTAVNVILFSLMHWPCSTTCLSIRKESGSWRWTGVAILVPALVGMGVCFLFTAVVRGLGL